MLNKKYKRKIRAKYLIAFILIYIWVGIITLTAFSDGSTPMDVSDTAYGGQAYGYLKTIVSNFPCRNTKANGSWTCGDWIITQLQGMGYSVNIHNFKTDATQTNGRNIIVEKNGRSDRTLLICAHYDSVDTFGCDDNGSGTSVLMEVANRIAGMQTVPECNIRMIFFDDEEEGYVGSRNYC